MRGFGFQIDVRSGFTRSWYVGADGVKRWASNDQPVIEPRGFTPSHDSASAYVGFCPYCAEYECDDACPGPGQDSESAP